MIRVFRGSCFGQAAEAYSYDAAGNRVTANGAAYLTGPNNQLQFDGVFSYSYNPVGNRTARYIDSNANGLLDAGDTAATTYAWDHRNRLTRVTDYATYGDPAVRAVDFLYDSENRWIGRDVDLGADGIIDTRTRFAYDGNQIVMQFDRATAPSDDPTDPLTLEDLSHRYLWNPAAVDQLMADEHVTTPDTPGSILWPLADHLGTIRDLAAYDPATNATTVVNHRTFDAYGNLQSQTSTAHDTLFAFTGRPVDAVTGLQNNLHRWYDAAVGRWMSEDPIGFEGRDGNLYGYAENGPINASDPTGLEVYTGWKEPGSGRINWLNPGNWQMEGDVWTSGGDVPGDDVDLYAHTVEAFKEYFTMTFDFKFASGYVQSPGKADRAGFVANSGVYIYNAIEVNIIDTNAILEYLDKITKDGRVHISRPPYVDETKWKRWQDGERFWGMLTGIPYGKEPAVYRHVYWLRYSRGWLEFLNPLKEAGEWNTMEIRFDPTFKNDVLLSYTLTVYVNGRLTHYGRHTTPTKDQGKLPMDKIRDYRIFLQSHHGSQVSFRNMVIKTGQDAPGMGDGPTNP